MHVSGTGTRKDLRVERDWEQEQESNVVWRGRRCEWGPGDAIQVEGEELGFDIRRTLAGLGNGYGVGHKLDGLRVVLPVPRCVVSTTKSVPPVGSLRQGRTYLLWRDLLSTVDFQMSASLPPPTEAEATSQPEEADSDITNPSLPQTPHKIHDPRTPPTSFKRSLPRSLLERE